MNGNDDDGNSLPKNCNKYDYKVVVWLLNYFMSFLPLPLDARGEGGWGFSEAVRWGARDRSGFVFGPVFVYGSCIITLCNISCVHKYMKYKYIYIHWFDRAQSSTVVVTDWYFHRAAEALFLVASPEWALFGLILNVRIFCIRIFCRRRRRSRVPLFKLHGIDTVVNMPNNIVLLQMNSCHGIRHGMAELNLLGVRALFR